MRVTGTLDLGECRSLNADDLPSEVSLLAVQTPPPLNDGYFKFVRFGVRQAQISAVPARNASDYTALPC